MGVINGTTIRLYDGTTPIAYATSSSFDESAEVRETVSKDSVGSYQEIEIGQLSGTLTCEAFLSEDATVGGVSRTNYYLLRAKFAAKTAISWRMTSDVSGDVLYTGSAYITAISMSAPVEENATFSLTLTINGAPTAGTVA